MQCKVVKVETKFIPDNYAIHHYFKYILIEIISVVSAARWYSLFQNFTLKWIFEIFMTSKDPKRYQKIITAVCFKTQITAYVSVLRIKQKLLMVLVRSELTFGSRNLQVAFDKAKYSKEAEWFSVQTTESYEPWVLVQVLLLICCVTSGKLLHLSVPPFASNPISAQALGPGSSLAVCLYSTQLNGVPMSAGATGCSSKST